MPWKAIALGTIGMFASVLAAVTVVEAVAGRPLTDVVRGDSGSGTTVFGGSGSQNNAPVHTPTVTVTVTPSVVVTTPVVTKTAPAKTVTGTSTPTTTQTPTTTSTPSQSASQTKDPTSAP